ncbi:hypothetical protein BHK98_01055 [Hornefia porci]|uniref:DUF1287 domain-containing protein n=2 Tax=Hornefia porci TaxID=2652292 RepID=A0A1Q9JEX5_9FIRM|nr:hypothetical protein BHK98_01055 [Hornefia porci]
MQKGREEGAGPQKDRRRQKEKMARGKRQKNRRRYRLKPRFYVIMAALLLILFLLLFRVITLMLPLFVDQEEETAQAADHGCTYQQGIRIMIGAKGYINTGLTYSDRYYSGGYPPAHIGVCTDVVWRGLTGLDVTLKDLVDQDVASNFQAYSQVIASADPSIDFRLVPVLRVYFDRHCVRLSDDPFNLLAWQPGDFVVYDDQHVAVVSAMRSFLGYPYIIQHGKDPAGDEDRLFNDSGLKLTGHYRWPKTIEIGSN